MEFWEGFGRACVSIYDEDSLLFQIAAEAVLKIIIEINFHNSYIIR